MSVNRKWLVLIVMVPFAQGCNQEAIGAAATGTAAETPGPFVLFTQPRLSIDRVGETAEIPAAVGSTLTQQTLASDDPATVEVTPGGGLRGVKAGRTTVRAVVSAGQVLEVEVRAGLELVLIPNPLTLQPRAEGELAMLNKMGGMLEDPGQAEWFSSAPTVALVQGGRVKAGDHPGTSIVTAMVAGREVRATVIVTGAKSGSRGSP